MGDNAAFIKEVKTATQAELEQYGVVIGQFSFIGAARPPQVVADAINLKLTAVQKALQLENELKQSEASARKLIAVADGEAKSIRLRADAEAYANKTVALSVTPNLIEYERVKKWDGKMITPIASSFLLGGNK